MRTVSRGSATSGKQRLYQLEPCWDDAGRASVSAEYDDCKRAARRTQASLRDVVRAAEEAGRDTLR